jgi:hypothetical protein
VLLMRSAQANGPVRLKAPRERIARRHRRLLAH